MKHTSCCFSLRALVKSILDSHILLSVCCLYLDMMSSSARRWSSSAALNSPFSRWTSRMSRDSRSILAIKAPLGRSLEASFSVSTSSLYWKMRHSILKTNSQCNWHFVTCCLSATFENINKLINIDLFFVYDFTQFYKVNELLSFTLQLNVISVEILDIISS